MSHTQPQKPKLAPGRTRHYKRQLLESWPLLVWIAVLGVTVYTYRAGVTFRRMNGTVGVYQEAIAAPTTGRLIEVSVNPGDTVEKGQVVARLDTTLIDRELLNLKEQIEADRQDRLRRFQSDINDIESELREYQLAQAEDLAELTALKSELKLREEDLAQNRITPDVVDKIRIDIASLEAKTELYPKFISELESRLQTAEESIAKVKAESPEGSIDTPQYTELDILRQQRENMSLRAVHSGKVYRTEKEPGEIVNEGETIVRVVAKPENIIGLLPQEKVTEVNIGSPVWVASTADRHTHFKSKVIAISPRISSTPDRASPLPNKMVRGREITVELPVEAGFLPGQTVIIEIEEPGGLPEFLRFLEFE